MEDKPRNFNVADIKAGRRSRIIFDGTRESGGRGYIDVVKFEPGVHMLGFIPPVR